MNKKGRMKKKTEQSEDVELISERVKELHRVETKDSDGRPVTLLLLSDPDQFIIASEKTVQDGKRAGVKTTADRKYYATIEGALQAMLHHLAKAEAKDLKTYIKSVNDHLAEFKAFIKAAGLGKDPF